MNTRHPDFGSGKLAERESTSSPKSSLDRADSLAQIAHHPFEKEENRLVVNQQQNQVSPKLTRRAPLPPSSQQRLVRGDQLSPLPHLDKVNRAVSRQKDVCAKAILGNQLIQDQSNSLKRLVGEYIQITDITIQDITPKYVMHSLVNAMLEYVREDLLGDLMRERCTVEAQEELVRREENSEVIHELVAKQLAIKLAMEKISKLSW